MRQLYILPVAATLTFAVLAQACGEEAAAFETPAVEEQSAAAATSPASAKTYPTATVTVEDIARPIRITGRVVPLQEATIASQVPGIVLPNGKLLQEGTFYRKGETLVAIDDEALRLNLRAARAEFTSALVRLLPTIRNDHRRAYPTYKAFVDAIDPAKTLPRMPDPGSDTLRYYLAANGIAGQYYRIQAQEATLDDYIVRAPFSGKLTQANVEPGAYVAPGAPLATLSRTDVYEVMAALPAEAAARLKVGQSITLRSRNLDQSYRATLHRFSTGIDETSQSVTAFLRVSGAGLQSGLFLEGELEGQSLKAVTALPKEVLNRDGNVYTIAEGIVRLQPVDVAAIESDKVYLRGLAPGTRVITGGVQGEIVGTRAL